MDLLEQIVAVAHHFLFESSVKANETTIHIERGTEPRGRRSNLTLRNSISASSEDAPSAEPATAALPNEKHGPTKGNGNKNERERDFISHFHSSDS